MYAEIVGAVQSTKALAELLKAANSLSNYSELLTAVTAVQQKLTDAIASELQSQEKQAALAEKVRELEAKLAEVEGWDTLMRRYMLHAFPTKAMAYALRDGMEQEEPMHYLCTSCADRKQKSILQPNGRYLSCPSCKNTIATESAPPRSAPRSAGASWMAR